MIRATYLLESYTELGWIRHPNVSSALVVASLRREGRGTSTSTTTAQKHDIDKNKEEIGKLSRELTRLKNKNPSWNTRETAWQGELLDLLHHDSRDELVVSAPEMTTGEFVRGNLQTGEQIVQSSSKSLSQGGRKEVSFSLDGRRQHLHGEVS